LFCQVSDIIYNLVLSSRRSFKFIFRNPLFLGIMCLLKVGEAAAVLVFGSVVTTALSLSVGVLPSVYELLGAAAVIAGTAAMRTVEG
jgi:hypothetical protein